MMDDFVRIQELGLGAYSKVYSCQKKEDLQKGNSNQCPLYAIKIIDKNHMKLNKKQHHAYIEKDMLQYLKHEGIIRLFQTFQDKDNLYFLIELAPECLSELIKLCGNQKMNPQLIQFYSAEIILILEHIHSKGIVHRDIKPENFIITQDRHLKLIDFGTAVIFDEKKVPEKLTQQIQNYRNDFVDKERKRQFSFVGTNAYLTPEMILDQPVNPGTDLWALAIMMYRMYTGTVPFKGEDEDELYHNIQKEEISFPQSIPLLAQDLMKQLLIKSTEERLIDYQKIKEHPYFSNLEFNTLFTQTPPIAIANNRDQRKSKTFVQEPISQLIYQEMVEKDSGCKRIKQIIIISYYSQRLLVLKTINSMPYLYYTNPKKNDKKTDIKSNQLMKYQLLKSDKFVIIDDQSKKYIFKSHNAKKWIQVLGETMNYWQK